MNSESLYPAKIAVKVFLEHEPKIKKEISAIVKKAFPDLKNKDISCTESKNQKYLSMTFVLHVQKKEDIEQLYQTLSQHPHIKMVL